MAITLAIHWAATTHGTWLHGDPRGSWRNGRLIGVDPYLEAEARAHQSSDAVLLGKYDRALVAKAFGEVVREHGYQVLAATIQATHVHLVFAPLPHDVKIVVARLKRRSTMKVKQSRLESPAILAGRNSGQDDRAIYGSLWTAGRFPVFIFDEAHLANAIEYVRDHNRRLELAADPFEWIEAMYPPGEEIGGRANLRIGERLRF